MAATFGAPDSPKKYTRVYAGFKGVDLSTDPTQIDEKRGADGTVNLISDAGGNPEKRPGWRTLMRCEAPVNGLYRGVLKGQEVLLCHGGAKLYRWTDSGLTLLLDGIAGQRGSSFVMNDKLWVLTGGEYLCYDGQAVTRVDANAYVPTTTIAAKPTGGGQSYDAVNLLSPKRRNTFLGDGTAKAFQLDATDVQAIEEIRVNGGVWGTERYTLDGGAGRVSFQEAPPAPPVTGVPNVEITFRKPVEGYADRINHCTLSVVYGGGGSDRVFLSGNPDHPSTDWHCDAGDPTYFPDLSYSRIGADGTRIMGYCRMGDDLAIVKQDNRQDATIYLRGYTMTDTGVLFPVRAGVAGVGAVAAGSFGYLLDEPLFLSRTGVYALTASNITAMRQVQNRSYYVDARLTREAGLENAVCAVWNGYYILCVDARCYVLDGRQNKAYKPQSYGDFVYECYYWEGVPAVCFLEADGNLYFGTSDGRICRFNTDREDTARYTDDGAAIVARWATKSDDDGDFMRKKTMVKRGSGVMIKPYARSGAKIYARTDRDVGRIIRSGTMDLFRWEDIDFERITFNGNDTPQVIPFNVKRKKYLTMQLLIENDGASEGFGIYGIIKRYTVGGYNK